MFKELKTLVLFIYIYIIITVIELMICYAIDWDPDIFKTSLAIVFNMAPIMILILNGHI